MYLAPTDRWYLERIIWLIAGIVILASTCLGLFVNRYWFILTCIAGFNMIIFSLTGFCPMAVILNKIGVKPLNKT
jgi:membrane protein implicated in regulation of membrane protease activity